MALLLCPFKDFFSVSNSISFKENVAKKLIEKIRPSVSRLSFIPFENWGLKQVDFIVYRQIQVGANRISSNINPLENKLHLKISPTCTKYWSKPQLKSFSIVYYCFIGFL